MKFQMNLVLIALLFSICFAQEAEPFEQNLLNSDLFIQDEGQPFHFADEKISMCPGGFKSTWSLAISIPECRSGSYLAWEQCIQLPQLNILECDKCRIAIEEPVKKRMLGIKLLKKCFQKYLCCPNKTSKDDQP